MNARLEPDLESVACDLCGRSDVKVLFVARDTNLGYEGTFPVVRCRHCGLVFTSPRPRGDTIAAYYPNDSSYVCFAPSDDVPPIDDSHPVVSLLNARGVRRGRVCDIGCGTASFLRQMQLGGWDVWGIEPSPYARAVANERLGDERVFASLDEASWAPIFFDAVTLWHVLEHVPSPSQTLRAVEKLLKPGGVLGIAVPNFASFECRVLRQDWIAIEAPRHFYHFEEATLRECVTRSGLQVECVRQYPGAVSLSANVLRPLKLLVQQLTHWRRATRHAGVQLGDDEESSIILARTALSAPKDWIRTTLAGILRPAAWVIAKAGGGPELYLLASKVK